MSELNRNACPNPVGMGVRMILGITVRIQIGTGVRLTSEYATLSDPSQAELFGLFLQPIQFDRQLPNLPMKVVSLLVEIVS